MTLSGHRRPGQTGAPDRGATGAGIDVRGRDCRDRTARHQAADGLFLDQPHGFCNWVGLAAGTAQGVQGMLVYMAIYVTHEYRCL